VQLWEKIPEKAIVSLKSSVIPARFKRESRTGFAFWIPDNPKGLLR
jgi:hypothetical protein